MTRLNKYLNDHPKVAEAVWNLLGEIEEGAIAESVHRFESREDYTDPEVIRDEVVDTDPIHKAADALALAIIKADDVQDRVWEAIKESIRDKEIQRDLEGWRP